MKNIFILILLILTTSLPIISNAEEEKSKEEVKQELQFTDKVSYSIGMDIGRSLKELKFGINVKLLAQAIEDVINGNQTLLTQGEAEKIMAEFSQQKRSEMEKEREEQGVKNKKAGEEFLAENKKKEGVKTTQSGLQYIVLKEGNGPSPKETDSVKVHYRGTLIDGTEFDSSYSRGEPTTFPLKQVIPGWQEGIQLMKVGGKYKLFIPPHLAYGEKGAGMKIPPNTTLIFEVELLEIVNDNPTETKEKE